MEPFDTLFFLVAVQGYFLALLLLLKKPRTLPATLLSVFIALVSTETLLLYLLMREPRWIHAVMANRPIWFLYGPIVYGFGRAITGNWDKPRLFGAVHMVPFLICVLILSIVFFPLEPSGKLEFLERFLAGHRTRLDTAISLAAVAHLVAYGGALAHYLVIHIRMGRRYFSSSNQLKIRSLIVLLVVLWFAAALLFVNWAHVFGEGMTEEIIAGGIFGIMSVIVYSMGYFGLCRPAFFDTERLSPVYQDALKDGMVGGESAACMNRITEYMKREQPFLSSDFCLQDLSVGIGVPAHRLSRTINQETGANFFQLVNQYRIDEVRKMMADPVNGEKTLLVIALDAGFNSKSTFNAAFKKVVGMTPSRYRRTCTTL